MIVALIFVAASACLLIGVTADAVILSWVALGLCVIGGATLIARLVLARPEHIHARHAQDEDAEAVPVNGAQPEEPVPGAHHQAASADEPDEHPTTLPSGTAVLTIPGRRRYHRQECELLVGHDDTEELTLTEALEEGFTRCTVCSIAGQTAASA